MSAWLSGAKFECCETPHTTELSNQTASAFSARVSGIFEAYGNFPKTAAIFKQKEGGTFSN